MPESELPKSVFDMPAFTPAAPSVAERPQSVFTVQPEPAAEPVEEPKPAASRRRDPSAAGQAAAATEEGSN